MIRLINHALAPARLLDRLCGQATSRDWYEPTVAAWFATILEEVDRFGESSSDWLKDHPCL
jgi:hypothetical protein